MADRTFSNLSLVATPAAALAPDTRPPKAPWRVLLTDRPGTGLAIFPILYGSSWRFRAFKIERKITRHLSSSNRQDARCTALGQTALSGLRSCLVMEITKNFSAEIATAKARQCRDLALRAHRREDQIMLYQMARFGIVLGAA
jgi:hypothetical protein